MTTEAHTPGPWAVTSSTGDVHSQARYGENWICQGPNDCVNAPPPAERAANARLISAAPDLLREAKTAVEELEYFVEFAIRQIEFEGDGDAGLLAVKNLRAAINRAEGRS